MIFSSKSEYGVRVMVALARHADAREEGTGEALSLAEIAAEHGMPLAYLEHLVARLRRAGLIDSRRGARGGYLLARPAEQITLAEVIEALEGVIAPIECISLTAGGELVCARESESSAACPTKLLWTRVRGAILATLHQTTLAELLAGSQGMAVLALGAGAGQEAGAVPSGRGRSSREPLTTGA